MNRTLRRSSAVVMLLIGVLFLSGCQHPPETPTCDRNAKSSSQPGELATRWCQDERDAYNAYQHQTFGQKLVHGDSKSWLKAGVGVLAVLLIGGYMSTKAPAETPEQRAQREHQEQAEALARAQKQASLQEQLQREERQRVELEAQQRAAAAEKERLIQQEMDRVRREEL